MLKHVKAIFVIAMIVILAIALMGSSLNRSFVGSVAIYEATGELHMVYAGEIENLMYSDGYAKFTFEDHTYTYINYFIEIVK